MRCVQWVYWPSQSFCAFSEVCGRCFPVLPHRHLWRTVVLGGATWGLIMYQVAQEGQPTLRLCFGWRSEFGVPVVPLLLPIQMRTEVSELTDTRRPMR